jgi:phosphatidylserine decarboxylase
MGDSNVFAAEPRSASPDLTPTPSPTAASLPPPQSTRYFLPSIPKILSRRSPQPTTTPPDTAASTPSQSSSRQSSGTPATGGKRKKIPGPWSGQKNEAFELEADNDIVGIVMLEIHGATDLPRLRNSELLEFSPSPHSR